MASSHRIADYRKFLVAILTLDGPVPLTIDLMSGVYGIPPAKLKGVVDRAILVSGIKVIDPISLFLSKCHCFLGLDQAGRQDEKHVRMLCKLLPAHFEEALEDTIHHRASERALIQEIKLLLRILRTQRIKRTLDILQVEWGSLIPRKHLLDCGLDKVERFAASSIR